MSTEHGSCQDIRTCLKFTTQHQPYNINHPDFSIMAAVQREVSEEDKMNMVASMVVYTKSSKESQKQMAFLGELSGPSVEVLIRYQKLQEQVEEYGSSLGKFEHTVENIESVITTLIQDKHLQHDIDALEVTGETIEYPDISSFAVSPFADQETLYKFAPAVEAVICNASGATHEGMLMEKMLGNAKSLNMNPRLIEESKVKVKLAAKLMTNMGAKKQDKLKIMAATIGNLVVTRFVELDTEVLAGIFKSCHNARNYVKKKILQRFLIDKEPGLKITKASDGVFCADSAEFMEWLAGHTAAIEGTTVEMGTFKKLVLKGEDGIPLCNLVAVKKKPAAVTAAEKAAKALSVANQMKQPVATHNANIVAAAIADRTAEATAAAAAKEAAAAATAAAATAAATTTTALLADPTAERTAAAAAMEAAEAATAAAATAAADTRKKRKARNLKKDVPDPAAVPGDNAPRKRKKSDEKSSSSESESDDEKIVQAVDSVIAQSKRDPATE